MFPIQAHLVLAQGYPFGVAVYEISYTWQDIPDAVKNGEGDHADYATKAAAQKVGCGFWIAGPLLHNGVWRGLWVSTSAKASPTHTPPSPVPALIEKMGDWDFRVRKAAIQAIAKTRDVRALPAITHALLEDGAWEVRAAAAWALGELGEVQAMSALIQALQDSDEDVRAAAIEAISRLIE